VVCSLAAALVPIAAAAQAPASPPGSTAAPGPAPPADTAPAGTSSAPPADTAPAPPAPPPEPPKTIDVSVGGERPPAGASTLRRRDIREVPGILADPYRAIEVRPGVTPTVSGFPYFFIRGAPPGNIGYLFDGIQVPLLFHVGGGPSVIPASLVQKVTFEPGPYPASAGRFAGAIVDATSTPPPLEWKGEAALRLDVGGLVQGPVNDRVDVLAGGHYAYAGPLLSAIVPSVGASYGDYQARIGYSLSPGERLQLLVFGSYDYLALVEQPAKPSLATSLVGAYFNSLGAPQPAQGPIKTTLLDADFHRADLRYEKQLDGGGRALAAVTLGLDESRNLGARLAQQYKLAARALLEKPFWDGQATLRAGADVSLDDFHVRPCAELTPTDRCVPGDTAKDRIALTNAFRTLFPSRLDVTTGAFVETEFRFGERSSITPGVRVDYYHSLDDSDVAIDPKLAGRFAINRYVSLVPAVALASQRPAFAPLPALVIGGIPGGLQRSLQTSFGAEAHLGPIEIVAAAFRQATFNLTDAVGANRGTALDADRFLHRTTGDAYGLEIGAQGALRRDLLFLLSYTLSRATRRTDDGRTIPSAYDRTHVAQLALLYDFGGGFRGGVRHVFYTGFPADEASAGHAPLSDPPRVKPFYRLDARLSKRWTVGKTAWVSLVLDIQNATLSKDTFDVSCTAQGCTPRVIGPVAIPALALEAGF
jgi:hypothetical protein